MPSLLRSSKGSRRLSSPSQEFKDALEFLFAIVPHLKGVNFLPPTVEEYFWAVKQTRAAFLAELKTRKTATRKTATRKTAKTILVTGGASPPGHHHSVKRLARYLFRGAVGNFDTLCDSVMALLAIASYATMAYSFFRAFSLCQIEAPNATSQELASRASVHPMYANSMSHPYRWFLHNYFPEILEREDELFVVLQRTVTFGSYTLPALNVDVTVPSSVAIGIVALLRNRFNAQTYHAFFEKPIACILYALGIRSCRGYCF
jgi:hypothetical protein